MTGLAPTDSVRVLHVDDEPDFAELVAATLERSDDRFAVDTATSAAEGLDRLSGTDYDCVVSDYDMPREDGIDFLERVREREPTMPFILFTGKGSEEIASEAISAGVSDYLQKETGQEQYELLANRILNQVERTRAERELAERESHLQQAQAIGDVGSWHIDLEDDDLYWSDEVYDLFGLPGDESLTYEEFLAYVHPEDRETVDAAWQAALEGADYDLEHRIVTADGETRWVHERADLEFDDDGNPTSALGVVQDVTERKEREEELERYERLIETVAGGVFAQDAEGRYAFLNSHLEELSGYDREEVIGREPGVFLPDDEVERFQQGILEMLEGSREKVVAETELTTADGDRLPIEGRMTLLPSDDGFGGTVGVVHDITQRRERERELRAFREAVEAAGHVIYWTDDEGTIQYVNPAFEETTGWTAEEAVGRTPAILNSGTHEDAFFDGLWETISSGETWRSEVVNETKAGETYIVDQTIAPVEDERGEIQHYVAVNADITGQKKYEFDLERYEAMIENSEDGIYVFDADGGVEYVNQRVVEVSGIPRSDWLGSNIDELAAFEVLTEDEIAAVKAGIEAVLETEESEVRVELTPDLPHDLVELELRLTPFKPEEDLVIAFSRDVTEQKRREQALERQNERLDQFASVVSHDLRNPLEVASGRLELAREDVDNEHLEAVAAAHDRIETQIDDLLTLARNGGDATEPEAIDLADAVRRCRRHVQTSEATVVTETDRTIRATPGRLQHLLENLLRNAVEHGGPDVTVTVGDLPEGFYVADDGPGIPPGARERVFEAGYSADGGTGLGLNIVGQVADAHGWDIAVTESDAGGARFEFREVAIVD